MVGGGAGAVRRPTAAGRLRGGAACRGAAADDDMAEIQKLAQLHTQGILTDEEFAAKKKQILGI